MSLSTPFHKYDHVCSAAFGFWRGATREHSRQRSVTEEQQSQKPNAAPPSGRRFSFGPGCVARSLQIRVGYARVPVRKHLAPCRGRKLLAANVTEFTLITT